MASMLVLLMAGCKGTTSSSSEATSAGTSSVSGSNTYELALITDIGTIDDKSFNQGAWEGLKAYADAKNITNKYYQPTEKTTDAYVAAIDLAVKGGAKVIVTPGYLFEPAVFVAQDKYPDVKFVLLDGTPRANSTDPGTVKNNVYSIFYAEQEAGFLAGYAAVKEGFTKLGFMGGMAVPAVVRYGYGFVQGAEYAAKEMKLAASSVEIKYTYVGDFSATPEHQTLAASWYQAGTQVIFACGGAVGNSVMAAAEAKSGKVIGVDVDQSSQSATVITSAMKMLGNSVESALKAYYDGTFPGGKSVILDAKANAVGLPSDLSKFTKFTKADYDTILGKLVNDTDKLASTLVTDTGAAAVTDIKTTYVKTTLIK